MRKKALCVLGACFGLLILFGVANSLFHLHEKSQLYASASSAAESGLWPEALGKFHKLVDIDPDYRDVQVRLDEALDHVLDLIPEGLDPQTEIDLVRWLEASGELVTLAEVLDRCVVSIPAGSFTMGSDAGLERERPQRQVYLDAFEIDRYEVTNVQYQRFVHEAEVSVPRYWLEGEYPSGLAAYPVVGISWRDADAYCRWAGKRLPSEAEWERACRGTDGHLYPWGDVWDPDLANVGLSQGVLWPSNLDEGWALLLGASTNASNPNMHPVGSYPDGASLAGVMDMAGNVSEWVADWYNWQGYWDLPAENPLNLSPRWNHSLRGSAWFDWRGLEDMAYDHGRCSARNSSHSDGDLRIGFRCVRSVP
jgi:formylglycine-generating enzyme required for sulfatase activity